LASLALGAAPLALGAAPLALGAAPLAFLAGALAALALAAGSLAAIGAAPAWDPAVALKATTAKAARIIEDRILFMGISQWVENSANNSTPVQNSITRISKPLSSQRAECGSVDRLIKPSLL